MSVGKKGHRVRVGRLSTIMTVCQLATAKHAGIADPDTD